MMKSRQYIISGLIALIISFNSCEESPFFDDPRDELTGEWLVDEESQIFGKKSTNRFYSVNISKDKADSTVLYIDGFYELDGKVKIQLDGLNIAIPDQDIDGFLIESGSGTISGDYSSITLYYYVKFTGDRDIVRADYSRPE